MADRDRFTTRCRLPSRALIARPRSSSQYLVYRLSGDAEGTSTAAVCRAAVGDTNAPVVDSSVTIHCNPLAYKQLTAAIGPLEEQSDGQWVWIPHANVRSAVAVTLQLVDGAKQADVAKSLQDTGLRQLLLGTIQQQWAVCMGATVRLPWPNTSGDCFERAAEWKVTKIYPESDFVRVTPSTRVTFTTPPEPIETVNVDSDTTSPEKETNQEPTLSKIGGLKRERAALREMILMPVEHPNLREQYGLELPKGLLLCGPPGVGKTLLVRTVVQECRQDADLRLQVINGAEIMTSGIGDAENALRNIFQRAKEHSSTSPTAASVIFIDELDALCPKRDEVGGSGMAHSRVVAQLLTLMDGAESHNETLVVVGATNLPNAIDPALRRPGRFDRELFISPPSASQRQQIFETHMADMPYCLDGNRDAFLSELATNSIGYVGADIAALCREALAVASTRHFVAMARDRELDEWWTQWRRRSEPVCDSKLASVISGFAWKANPVAIPLWFIAKSSAKHSTSQERLEFFSYLVAAQDQHESNDDQQQDISSPATASRPQGMFEVTMADFEQAMTVITASALRGASGFFKNVQSLGWDSIGGQTETKLALQQALEWPLKFPHTFSRLGVKPPRGILLYGPPGCSKSSVVRAAAHASGATFLSLSAAKVFSPFFGDAEASIRQVFRDARAALPAIVFFDEIDAMVAKREFGDGASGSEGGGSSTSMRILSTLLNEMDGVEAADGLLVIGATNMPECIDAALMRPGRFDRILFVDLPTEDDRLAILQIHSRTTQLDSDVDLHAIAAETPFFSGAELENVCREAALHALRESIEATSVAMRHFRAALDGVRPVSSEVSMTRYFEFAAAMGHLG